MADHNPYAAPASDAAPRASGTLDEDRVVTPEIIEAMAQTRPWVVFLSILGFIGAGVLVLTGVATFALGTFGAGAGEAGFVAIVCLICAALYVFPSLYLFRYGASIKLMQQGYGVHALVEALRQQRSFWKLSGIIALVIVVLYGFALVIGIASS